MESSLEDTIQRQAALLKKQEAVLEELRNELSTKQIKSSGELRRLQTQYKSLQQQWSNQTLQDVSEEVQHLKRQLESALREKELTEKENKANLSKIQELKHELMSKRSNGEIQTGDSQLGFDIRDNEYSKVIETLESELERLRSRLQQSEDEKIITMKNNVTLKKQLSAFESQLEHKSQETHLLQLASEEKDKNQTELKNSFSSLNSKFLEQSEDLRTLLAQTELLHKNKSEQTKILSSVKGRLEDAESRVLDSVKLTEAAIMEKDAALLREKHSHTEIKRLEKAVTLLMDEAGLKAKTEASKLKDEFNTNIKKLSEDLMQAELSVNTKQLQFERSLRDLKKAEEHACNLENKYEKAYKEHESTVLMLNQRINSLEVRIARLQSEKESTTAASVETTQDFGQQQEELFLRINELEGRLLKAHTDYENIKVSAEEAHNERNYLNEKINHEKELYETKCNSLQRQVKQATQELSELSSMYESQLEALDETHTSTLKQLYDTISTAQENCTRLQQQIDDQKEMYDQRISDLNRKCEDSKKRSEEHRKEAHEAIKKALVAEDLSNQYKIRIKEVEDRLHTTELRFATFRRTKNSVSSALGHLQL